MRYMENQENIPRASDWKQTDVQEGAIVIQVIFPVTEDAAPREQSPQNFFADADKAG